MTAAGIPPGVSGRVTGLGLKLLAAVALLAVTVLVGTCIGETAIPLETVAMTLANRLFDAGYPLDRIDEGIVWAYRLTRAIVAASCGAVLAVSGVVLQSLLRNPLAEPYLLGISAGASTGACVDAPCLASNIFGSSAGSSIGRVSGL